MLKNRFFYHPDPDGNGGGAPNNDLPAGSKTFSEDYVKALRGESAGYRTRAQKSETALRSLFGLKEGEELGDIDSRMAAYKQALEASKNDAVKAANDRLISAAINSLEGYDTKLLEKLIDRGKITVSDDGKVEGLKEAAEAVEKDFPAVKKSALPRVSGSAAGIKDTADKKEKANEAIRAFFGHQKG